MKVEGFLKILTYTLTLTGFVSVAAHVGATFVAGFVALMLPAAWRDWRRPFVVPRWILNALAVAMVIVTFLRLRIDNIVVPAVDILLVMIALKFMEDKQPRDYFQIFVLSLLLLAGSSLLSLDMIFLAYLIAFLFLLSSATVLLAYFAEDPALVMPRRTLIAIALKSLLIPLVALPVTVILFVLLPRTSHPFFDFLNRTGPATSGFSDHVRLGGVADIQEDTTIAFRVAMARLDEDALYWRGIVFDQFDGRTWKTLRTPPATTFHISAPTRRVRYTVYLEPSDNRYLFTLDKPVFVSLRNARGGGNLVYTLPDPILRKIRYEGVSVPADDFIPAHENPRAYLDLPPGLEDIRALTASLTRGLAPLPAVRALHGYLHHGPFRYALSDLPRSSRPLQDFLFRHRYGNCEYFASAMTVMARSAGVPARLVGGYRGGYYHDLGGYYAVLQKNAHVWTEVWLEGHGWLRVDPTPAALLIATSVWQGGFGFRVRMIFDLLEYYWNINVIAYDLQKQFRLLTTLERTLRNPDWHLSLDPGQRLWGGGALLSLLALAGVLLLRRLKWPTPEERLLARFHRRLARLGHTRHPSEGLEAFIARLPADVPRRQAEIFVAEFERFYYKDIAIPKHERARLAALIRSISGRRPEG
ncbi:MAG: DUF3488 and transglutaminase-like domain-containing protein [Syntrophales bacterium]|nr:DUF3488 and transglutaminase-like domain-containing protein [Syntrophales bacterium]